MHLMLKGIKITSDQFYQTWLYYFHYSTFIVNYPVQVNFIWGQDWIIFLLTLHRPVRNQPVNITRGSVFTRWLPLYIYIYIYICIKPNIKQSTAPRHMCTNRIKLHAQTHKHKHIRFYRLSKLSIQRGKREKRKKTTLKIYEYTWIHTHTHTHTHTWTINSYKTFTDTNPGIKKNHNSIKTISTIKARKTALYIISLLKMTIKSETRVEHSYIKLNQMHQINLWIYQYIYIYIYIYIYTFAFKISRF